MEERPGRHSNCSPLSWSWNLLLRWLGHVRNRLVGTLVSFIQQGNITEICLVVLCFDQPTSPSQLLTGYSVFQLLDAESCLQRGGMSPHPNILIWDIICYIVASKSDCLNWLIVQLLFPWRLTHCTCYSSVLLIKKPRHMLTFTYLYEYINWW